MSDLNNFDINNKLKSSHNKIIAKAKIASKAKRDIKIAKEIEDFLRLLKISDQNINNTKSKNIIQESFREQAQEVRESVASVFGQKWSVLFHRSHSTDTFFGGDDIFEEELAATIAAIEAKATNSSIDVKSHLQNSNQANVNDAGRILNETQKEIITEFNQRLCRRLSAEIKGEGGLYTTPVFRSGKVDVVGGTISGTAQLDPKWEKLASLFIGRTFSVKNYLYFEDKDNYNLSLGSTDYYKALYSALSSAGYSDKYVKKIIFSGMVKINKNEASSEEIIKHFYHMKFLYELTGLGLRDKDNERLDSVDFFIYNEPNTANVYVKSTAAMIQKELEESDTSNIKMRKHISLLRESFK